MTTATAATTATNGKLTNVIDAMEFIKTNNLDNGTSTVAELIGDWIWITFDCKPEADVRTLLKNAGFRWSGKRKQWYNNLGVRSGWSRGGGSHPRTKYGSVRTSSID